MVKKIIGMIIKWVGISGLIATLLISVAIWAFYDISDNNARLDASETTGMMLFVLLLVSTLKALYLFAKKLKENRGEDV
ncbi:MULTISPECIES: hypothetical protein [Pseudoalteromonas]|uniref:Uncharacterized protein n=1 Tax=Pseudoalteromonas amylolytica TaxID=1859457 RepID=A0A1S1MUH2_9GAMM|nr:MULTISPECIES: hypothetical protein [Pseudoalteromonas]OHU84919.1 hypothetical protein BFC16_19715 [Pseudoalteromonas sp. JW3]OHU90130.1 hypothetical protein BET10_15260 [Pseudoalteromonas amylolytica]